MMLSQKQNFPIPGVFGIPWGDPIGILQRSLAPENHSLSSIRQCYFCFNRTLACDRQIDAQTDTCTGTRPFFAPCILYIASENVTSSFQRLSNSNNASKIVPYGTSEKWNIMLFMIKMNCADLLSYVLYSFWHQSVCQAHKLKREDAMKHNRWMIKDDWWSG